MSDDGKKSWREIDAARIRGGTSKTPRPQSPMEQRAQAMASKAAKQDLEKLFSGSKLNKEKSARLQDIRTARGTSAYYDKIKKYCEDFGLPMEWEAQLLVLDHKDTSLVMALLDELKKTAGLQDLDQQKLLAQKLSTMEQSTFDSQLVAKIRELKAQLLR